MSKTLLRFAATFALLASLISLASAQQQNRIYREGGNWAEEITGSLTPAKNLRVKVDVGSVRIVGGSQPVINYVIRNRAYSSSEDKARREFDSYKISAYVRGDTAWIVGDWQGGRPKRFSGEFVINVPREMEWVKVETEGGSVSTTGIAGRADAESGGGSIHVDDIGGAINAETGGGSIDVGNVGGDLNLHTGGGSIEIRAAKGKINAESGGGSVVLISGLQGAVLETGGGSIEVKKCTGSVKATTGTIRASVELANGHQIRSDFSDIHVTTEGGEYGPKTVTAEGRLNGGGPVLKVRTTTGDITFRRASR